MKRRLARLAVVVMDELYASLPWYCRASYRLVGGRK